MSYDASGRLDTVADSFGKAIRFFYASAAANANLVHITLPDNKEIHYEYAGNGNLAGVIYPDDTPLTLTDNPRKTYHYENALFPSFLTGITDEDNNRYATWQYDNQGRAFSSKHGTGNADKYTLAYFPDDTTTPGLDPYTEITDPLGTVRTTHFSKILGVAKPTRNDQPAGSGYPASFSAITYDSSGNVSSLTDFNGHKTCYAYDLTRNLEVARVEGLASTADCAASLASSSLPAPARKITTEWHPTLRLPAKITEPGLETSYAYDDKANVTLKRLKDLATGNERTWTTTYTYSASGILTKKVEDGPRASTEANDTTTYDYYLENATCDGVPSGHAGCRGQLKQVTTAEGHITQITRYSANGQPEAVMDPNGLTTTLGYDARQRLKTMSVGGETTTYEYYPTGLLKKTTQPNGAYLKYSYNNAHRLVKIENQLVNTLTYTLDNMGNRTKEDMTDPNGQLARTKTQVYDALSRLQNLILPQ